MSIIRAGHGTGDGQEEEVVFQGGRELKSTWIYKGISGRRVDVAANPSIEVSCPDDLGDVAMLEARQIDPVQNFGKTLGIIVRGIAGVKGGDVHIDNKYLHTMIVT